MVTCNRIILALYSTIDTESVLTVLTGSQIVESRLNAALQSFHSEVLFQPDFELSRIEFPEIVRKVISKDIPVVHTGIEDDTFPDCLTAFQVTKTFKEKWISADVWCYFGITNHHFHLLNTMQNFSIRHYSSLLHEFWLDTNDVFHIDFETNYIHVFCKKNGSFLFYNKLYFENDVDIHYHMALIEREVLNSPEENEIIFSGEISLDSKIMKTLGSYFSKIRFINQNRRDFIVNDKVIDPLYFDKYLAMVCA